MTADIYCESYIKQIYTIYTKLSQITFVNIMKEFIATENIKQMYNTIILLLVLCL